MGRDGETEAHETEAHERNLHKEMEKPGLAPLPGSRGKSCPGANESPLGWSTAFVTVLKADSDEERGCTL